MCEVNNPGRFPEKSWVTFLTLRLLAEEPSYGYRLMEIMEEKEYLASERIESGTIYTILRRLEKKGLVESEWERIESGPDRRMYKVTDEGLRFLTAGLETMKRRRRVIDDLLAFYEDRFKGEQP